MNEAALISLITGVAFAIFSTIALHKDTPKYKKKLPKRLLFAIVVDFSFIFIGVFLSIFTSIQFNKFLVSKKINPYASTRFSAGLIVGGIVLGVVSFIWFYVSDIIHKSFKK